jgi:hypothetical protein
MSRIGRSAHPSEAGPSLGREVGIVDEAARLLALLLVWWVVTNTLR